MLKDLSREQQLIILGLALVVVTGLGVMAFRHFVSDASSEILIEEPDPQETMPVKEFGRVIVHVAGAVEREGVYKLKFGDRVIDALKLAGGAIANADLSSINLAEKVKDGQKITIPVKSKLVEMGSGNPVIRRSEPSSGGAGKVNINTADEKELCKVKGIGPSTARKIIEYRSNSGSFSKIEDIMKVKGIGKGKFGKIKDQIVI